MTGKLTDLNNHLFAALDRLGRDSLSGDDLEAEVRRAEAIVAVADQVTSNAKVMLQAASLYGQYGAQVLPMLPQIGKATGDDK